MRKTKLKMRGVFILIAVVFICSACTYTDAATDMRFSFDTSTPANSGGEKTIYINDDMERLELSAELKVDTGKVTLQVINTVINAVIWNGEYSEDTNFTIELNDLTANTEYLIDIRAVQSKKVTLVITSNEKLVKDKEKPDKYVIQ